MTAIRDLFLAFMGAHRSVSWRRLFVFVAACVMLWYGKIGEWSWAAVAMAFIGGEVLKRAPALLARGKSVPSLIGGLSGTELDEPDDPA